MGTIVERKSKTGTKYRAQVIKKKDGKVDLRKSTTFERRTTAAAWIKRIEREYNSGNFHQKKCQITVCELIEKLVATQRKEMGKTKSQVLKTIQKFDISEFAVNSLKPSDLIEFANQVAEGTHGTAAQRQNF